MEGLSVQDAVYLLKNYEELDWFLDKLGFINDKKEIVSKINHYDVLQNIELSKSKKQKSLAKKWLMTLKEELFKEYEESKEKTLFEKLSEKQSKVSKKAPTLFDQIKERMKSKRK